MPHNGHAFQPQQRRSAVFRVVELASEVGKCFARQQRAYLRRNGRSQRLFQQETHRFHQSFGNLQRHVADKAITNDDVHFAVI